MRWMALALVAAFVLAGCGSKSNDGSGAAGDAAAPLESGKGAISGLVIDDRYRPIPSAEVLLLPNGLTTETDGEGQFSFGGLEPGAYEARVTAPGHEGAPTAVDVAAGEYTDVEIQARRILSDSGSIVTTQYSVFIPCSFDYIVNGYIVSCLPDNSGDTYRPGFTTDVTSMGANITYMVHEAKMNQVGDYDLQVREVGGSAGGGRYAVGFMRNTDYKRLVNQHGVKNEEDNEQHNNIPWNNTKAFDMLVFLSGAQRETFGPISQTTCNQQVDDLNRGVGSPVRTCNWRGVGARFAIKATFIQSLFVGPPTVPIDSYHTLG